MRFLKITLCSFVLAAFIGAIPTVAEPVYTLALDNGTELVSYHRPVVAEDDENTILMLTDESNWIRLDRSSITDFSVEIPGGGSGAELRHDGAIVLGFVANDAVLTDADGESQDPATQLLQYMMYRDANRPDYSVDQFVEPSDAGAGGLPVSGLGAGPGQPYGSGATSFPVGSGGAEPVEPRDLE